MTIQTPVLDRFLSEVTDLVKNRDGARLQDFLQLEPPLPAIYMRMVDELRAAYPSGSQGDAQLQRRCEGVVSRGNGGGGGGRNGGSGREWIAFPALVKLYCMFLRDVNAENLLETYNSLRGLLNQSVSALGDGQMGIVILPTVYYLCRVLAKLAMGLDRRPDLIAHLLRLEGRSDQDEALERVTLVERSANVVREAFIKCLTDRSGTPGTQGKPEGKRVGIYLMANLCLKLLFQCGKLRNAEQMFASINAQSPPLGYFPASQRVTYLYYLGRYLFSNNLFFPAQIALQSSYDQCHRQALKQRNLILTYLIPCNMIMGHFPSQQLLQRPESQGLAERFVPICNLIVRGDYIAFRSYLAVDSPRTEWFARKGILLPLRNRCEVLVWRSLSRKVFIHGGFMGDVRAQAQRGPPPFLYLSKLEAAVRWLQSQHARSSVADVPRDAMAGDSEFGSQVVFQRPDADFVGLDDDNDDEGNGIADLRSKYEDYLAPNEHFDSLGRQQENRTKELVDGDLDTDYTQYEVNPYTTRNNNSSADNNNNNKSNDDEPSPMMREIESILSSLLSQGLMRGYLTHRNPRFAIPGARLRGALPTGFPNVWQTIYARESEESVVPGWVQMPTPTPTATAAAPAAVGGGRVVSLTGARPVGVQ